MEKKTKTPSLETYERYDLEERILSDTNLGRWFADVCAGKKPSVQVDEVLLALMEGHGLVRKRNDDWVLASDGRQFARQLGLIPGPSKFEIDPSLIEGITTKSEIEQSKTVDTPLSLQKIWKTFAKTRDEHCRNALIEHYLYLVKYIAHRLHTKLPDKIDLDDLISAGIFGLMDTIDAYDPAKWTSFETYCSPRIRGAIIDELRSMDWVPRLVRARAHQLRKAERSLEARIGHRPNEEELTKDLGMDRAEFNKLQRDANAVSLSGLDTQTGDEENEKDIFEEDFRLGKKSEAPLTEARKRDIRNFLTKELTRAERMLVVLYYYEDMTMKEIGATLDISESRVSQMHSSILARYKAKMNKRKEEFNF
jgi:RNA polymerase sigma factor for flagellar operon FliA